MRASRTLADPAAPQIERLRAAVALAALGEAAQAQIIADMACARGWDGEGESFTYDVDEKTRRLVRVGADGALMDEALPLEVAVAKTTSVGAATALIRDLVNLRSRHPVTWRAVQERRLPVWQGRAVAALCARDELDAGQTLAVEARLAPALGRVGYGRLCNLTRAAILAVAPEAARRRSERNAGTRYCTTSTYEDDPTSSYLTAILDTADAVFVDATLDRLADVMGDRGDTRPKDHRRAAALGVLATPALALSLLGVHTRRGMRDDQADPPAITARVAASALPTSQVYVHVSADTLAAGEGVARVESMGPVLIDQLSAILGHSRVRLTPVLHPGDTEPVVDAYEIPRRIREHVVQRDVYEVFPYSCRPARRLDLDHSVPYANGTPGQTRPGNLGPLSRAVHRAKTHCGWRLSQPEPGVFVWRTELGQVCRVGPDGTTDLTNPP